MDDDQVSEFWKKSLFEQLYKLPARERRNGHWRMSSETLNFLKKILEPAPIGPFYVPAMTPTGPDVLLGRPIEIDEDAEGATFEVPARSA